MPKKVRIAIDAMGGDFAPINEIQGAVLALNEKIPDVNLEIILVGNEGKIRSGIQQADADVNLFEIVNASQVVTMNDEPTAALKKKKDSSMYKAIELHANGYADAVISAGNTGAMLSTSTVLLGRIKGVSRPTIGSFFPTQKAYPALVLDVGANIDSKPRFLYEFAVMGSIYIRQVLGVENPKIALINIGEEKSKGTEVVKETYKMLKDSELNFVGNLEGRDMLQGAADVFVCDGFTGNILLKFAESFPGFLKYAVKDYASKSFLNKLMVLMVAPFLKKILSGFDYEEFGGVPLLGVNGNSIIGHGKSSPKAIKSMINRAADLVNNDLNGKIHVALNPPVMSENNQLGK